jgi:hypothetical protein
MADFFQSSGTSTQSAPDYFTKYLANIAGSGTSAAGNAQFVGPTDLQNQSYANVTGAGNSYQPALGNASQTLQRANTAASPLAAASGFLNEATSDPSKTAQGYMNPYTKSVVDSIGVLGQQNIQQNLAPEATAGAVGSGQFGSQRGAQVLGQTLNNANQQILAQQNSALQSGYQNAMQSAIQQNQVAGQAGSTAANAASAGQQNLNTNAQIGGDLATKTQALGLGAVNAQNALGTQQQQIGQAQQNFPLTQVGNLAALLRGYQMPVSTTTQFNPAGMSTLGGLASVAAGVMQPGANGGDSLLKQAQSWFAPTQQAPAPAQEMPYYNYAASNPDYTASNGLGGSFNLADFDNDNNVNAAQYYDYNDDGR